MSGHTGGVMELHFSSDGSHIYTASTDHTLGLWDISTGQRVKKFKGHTTFVNSVQGITYINLIFPTLPIYITLIYFNRC